MSLPGMTGAIAGSGAAAATGHLYWRVYVSATNGGTGIQLREMEFHSAVSGSDQVPACTTYNMGAAGSVIYSSDTGGAEAWKAFDNSTGDWWSFTGNPAWCGFLFPANINIVEVALTTSPRSDRIPTALSIDYSDDGTTWTTKASFSSLSLASLTTYNFAAP